MKKSTLIVMLSATALLAACSGKHEAGKSEFKKAINQAVQQRWQHAIPTSKATDIRLSLTFRCLK